MKKNNTQKLKILIMVGRNPKNMRGGTSTWVLNVDSFFQEDYNVDYLILPNWMLNITMVPDRLKALIYSFMVLLFNIGKWDIYMSHSPELSYVATLFSSNVIHVAHGNTNPVTNPTFRWGKIFYNLYEFFIKTVEKKAKLLYTVGEKRKGYSQLNQPINHDVSPINVKEKKNLIYAGRLEKVKNVDFIIKAYSELPLDIRKQNSLSIYGRGSEISLLKKEIDALGLKDQVILEGHIDNKDLINKINKSRVLLLASLYEGFPMVIAEALTVGTPVVSTNVGAISNAIENGKNGFLIDIEDGTNKYAVKINNVLDNLESFCENAYDSSSVFNAQSVYDKINNDIIKKFNF